ncbi:hypothetical protein [Ichthyenterobacterium magnum]|uniref:Lipoprotein n=1 Tax=Ichthyenterobacterium magnum TaxID=1230530 RepID=A0A420DXA4_9FLAO|nr:hypothetical protein [Ichthyenterobacterium magnum]RKE98827.1 hypothetical protein BXY80_0922 [Ichthyenterobacterium magnum]
MIKKLSLIFGLIFLIGCKDNSTKIAEDTKIDSEIIEKPKQEETFKLKLKGVFNKDDKFAMFYTESELEKFNPKKVVTTRFIGSEEIQEINLEAPSKVYPMNIMLDFGSNKEQTSIKIYECILKYKNKSFKIKGGDLKTYFNFNEGIKMQLDSLTFNFDLFKFHGKEVHNPYIIGKKKLTEVLDFEL